jgi:hypothetical protein
MSFGFGTGVDVDEGRLGGMAFSGGSTTFWLLFFFFAIAWRVFAMSSIEIGAAMKAMRCSKLESFPKHKNC